MKARIMEFIFYVCVIFTLVYVGFSVINIPIPFKVEKQYQGIIFDDENHSSLTVRIEGWLKKRLILADEFQGEIEFSDDETVLKEYSLWLSEPESSIWIEPIDYYINTINRHVLSGAAMDYENFGMILKIDMTSDWEKIHIYFIDEERSFAAPATTVEEAQQIRSEIYEEIFR